MEAGGWKLELLHVPIYLTIRCNNLNLTIVQVFNRNFSTNLLVAGRISDSLLIQSFVKEFSIHQIQNGKEWLVSMI